MKKVSRYGEVSKQLTSGYLHYTAKSLVQVLEKEFNIKEIKLIENQIIGATEKYRCVITVE